MKLLLDSCAFVDLATQADTLTAGAISRGLTAGSSSSKHFGNIRSVMTEERDQLQKIPGVGPKKAEQIVS